MNATPMDNGRNWNAGAPCKTEQLRSKYAQAVAEAVVKLIQSGKANYVKGWVSNDPLCRPHNIANGHYYTGMNALLLMAEGMYRGQNDMRFVTERALADMKDADGNPAQIKEGARPYDIWVPFKPKPVLLPPETDFSRYKPELLTFNLDGSAWLESDRTLFSCRQTYCVADTTLDCPRLDAEAEMRKKVDFKENEFLEKFARACGAEITNNGGSAYYVNGTDKINMPPKDSFASDGEYYGTFSHEFYHWTGASRRENRNMRGGMGSPAYAAEEVRAEMFAAMASTMLNLGASLESQAGYVKSWSQKLKDEPQTVYQAARAVQPMINALLDAAEGFNPQPKWMQKCDFSDVPAPLRNIREAEEQMEAVWRKNLGLQTRLSDDRKPAGSPAEGAASKLEAAVSYAYRNPDTKHVVEGHFMLPVTSSPDAAEALRLAVLNSQSRNSFVPEDLGLPEKRSGFASVDVKAAASHASMDNPEMLTSICEHELLGIEIRPAGSKPEDMISAETPEPHSFEEFASIFMLRSEQNDWNRYDPDGIDRSLPMQYSGPGWQYPSAQQIAGCVVKAGEAMRAMQAGARPPAPQDAPLPPSAEESGPVPNFS